MTVWRLALAAAFAYFLCISVMNPERAEAAICISNADGSIATDIAQNGACHGLHKNHGKFKNIQKSHGHDLNHRRKHKARRLSHSIR